jgi:hypothetical protein
MYTTVGNQGMKTPASRAATPWAGRSRHRGPGTRPLARHPQGSTRSRTSPPRGRHEHCRARPTGLPVRAGQHGDRGPAPGAAPVKRPLRHRHDTAVAGPAAGSAVTPPHRRRPGHPARSVADRRQPRAASPNSSHCSARSPPSQARSADPAGAPTRCWPTAEAFLGLATCLITHRHVQRLREDLLAAGRSEDQPCGSCGLTSTSRRF